MKKLVSCSLGMVAVLQLAGCASIVSGSSQPLSVETVSEVGLPVAGASCKLHNDKGVWFLTSPGSTTVQRSYEDLAVSCEKQPLGTGMLAVKSTTKGMAFGNILFGGFIGAGVDAATGAAYDYPTLIRVRMGAAQAPAAAPIEQAPSATPAVYR